MNTSLIHRGTLFWAALLLAGTLAAAGPAAKPPSAGSPLSEADRAWQAFQQAATPPAPPAEWSQTAPTKEQIDAFHQRNGVLAGAAAGKAREFYTQFPQDARAGQAREKELRLTEDAVQLGNTNLVTRLRELRRELLKDQALPENERLRLRVVWLQEEAAQRQGEGPAAVMNLLEQGIEAIAKDFPARQEPYNFMLQLLGLAVREEDVERARRVAARIEAANVPVLLKNLARSQVAKFDLLGRPLVLQGPGVDGKEINLADYRGKVVLINFWASWCPACMAEMPGLLALYRQHREAGLAVIGVNCDENLAAMEKVVNDLKLPWPQHFNEGSGEAGWARRFGVIGLPALWLVDRQGVLRDMKAHTDLEAKVARLLAEPGSR